MLLTEQRLHSSQQQQGSSGQLLSTDGTGVLSYVDAPSGATGGGSDKVIIENGTTITTNYTIGTTLDLPAMLVALDQLQLTQVSR